VNAPGHVPALVTVLFLGLIVWRMYIRLRRNVGRQRLTVRRPLIILLIYPLIAVLLTVSVSTQPATSLGLLALLGGIAVGVGLGIHGLRLTRFEVTPAGLFYTPNAHIGIALSLLFMARVAYRLIQVGPQLLDSTAASGAPLPVVTPLTLLALGPLIGYYTTYSIGLLRWRASVATSQATAGSV
jgi:hypothetical protein